MIRENNLTAQAASERLSRKIWRQIENTRREWRRRAREARRNRDYASAHFYEAQASYHKH